MVIRKSQEAKQWLRQRRIDKLRKDLYGFKN